MEVPPYPPSQGEFAVYDIPELEDRINYAVAGYYNAKEQAIGYYVRLPTDKLTLVVKYFSFQGFDDPSNTLDIHVVAFQPIYGLTQEDGLHYQYDIRQELESRNLSQPFKRLLALQIQFQLHSVRVYEEKNEARCLQIDGTVRFEDMDNNGQVTVDLETMTRGIYCSEMNLTVNDWVLERTPSNLSLTVFGFSLISLLLAIGNLILSLYTGVRTYMYMKEYFNVFYTPVEPKETNLSKGEYFRFVKLWDFSQLASDILTISESYFIANQVNETEWTVGKLDPHAVWLSVGGLLAWLSLLRFFKFHIKFHLLFSTIYKATFDVLAYLICVTVLFLGFWVCGYVVLSPYHVKFQSPSACAETLLSIVNGDEIYATLAMMEYSKTNANTVWWFTRFYILTYVAVFTIVVINLLIAIFMSAYDSIKEYNKNRHMQVKADDRMPRTLTAFIEDDAFKDDAAWTVGCCKFYHWLPNKCHTESD